MKTDVTVRELHALIHDVEEVEERIRVRAYDKFLERGQTPGDESQDWLAAEAEITSTLPFQLNESNGAFRGTLRLTGSEMPEVLFDDRTVLIRDSQSNGVLRFFRVSGAIDPNSIRAILEDKQTLYITGTVTEPRSQSHYHTMAS